VTTTVLAKAIKELSQRRALTGLYHLSADSIDKWTLLSEFNGLLGNPVQIVPDESLVIDRSLDSTRLRAASGWSAPPWNEMLGTLAAEVPAYDELRAHSSSMS
jgi:dTDP-4-dehydrorhamnose reductase